MVLTWTRCACTVCCVYFVYFVCGSYAVNHTNQSWPVSRYARHGGRSVLHQGVCVCVHAAVTWCPANSCHKSQLCVSSSSTVTGSTVYCVCVLQGYVMEGLHNNISYSTERDWYKLDPALFWGSLLKLIYKSINSRTPKVILWWEC